MSRSRFPWGWAALAAGGVYLLTRPAKPLPPPGPSTTGPSAAPANLSWMRSPDNWMALGGLYHWVAQRKGPATPQQIATALAARGFTDIVVQGGATVTYLELRANAGIEEWVPPEIEVYTTRFYQGSVVGAPPTSAAALTRGAELAAIAEGNA